LEEWQPLRLTGWFVMSGRTNPKSQIRNPEIKK
jgi:hypothetical protein